MRGGLRALCAMLGVVGATAAGTGRAEPANTELVEVRAETLVIGREGTRTAATDRAVLARGKVGLLRVATSLGPAGGAAVEQVSATLRVRWEPFVEGPEATGERGLLLAVDSRTEVEPSGETVLRSGGGPTGVEGSVLYEAYASALTGERVVVLLQARRWEEPQPGPAATRPVEPLPVTYRLWIYRKTLTGNELVGSPVLGSVVGHAASYTFGFALADLEGGPPTREELSVRVHSVDLRDGALTGTATLEGNIRGEHVEGAKAWSLGAGQGAELSLDLGGRSGDELGFQMVLVAGF